MSLDGKVAIVTGGAMGNGLGIVKTFLKAGAFVYIFDYADDLRKTITELKKEYSKVKGYILDIRSKDVVNKAVLDIMKEQKQIDQKHLRI